MNYNNLPNLNETVLAALDLFCQKRPPRLTLKNADAYLAAGSAGAARASRLIFAGKNCFFGDESDFRSVLRTYRPFIKRRVIKEAFVVSSSGEKDSLWQIKSAQKSGLKTTLLTCNADSRGARLADRSLIFDKVPEPYSYNSSTYLGMILGVTKEDPGMIRRFIASLALPKKFKKYSFFTFILPDGFQPIAEMINTKDDELFGPYSSLRAYTFGEARHAKFICRSEKELVISLGPNPYFGPKGNRWEIKLPLQAKAGFVLALSYYLVGLIQGSKPPYFKKDIARYCQDGPKAYGGKRPFEVVVPGN